LEVAGELSKKQQRELKRYNFQNAAKVPAEGNRKKVKQELQA